MSMDKVTDLKIRSAVATDLNRLVGMDHTCSSDYVWQLDLRKDKGQIAATLREVRLPRAIKVPYPRDHLSLIDEWNRNSRTFVALLGGEPIGYTRVLEQGTSENVWVQDLVIETEARRKGVAAALIQAIQAWAADRGNRQIFLEMSSKNHPAVCLAQKLGFEFSGYNDHYYATQDVALFFGRILK
ncbi:MAG: hypothetical protein B6I38_06290 [Anaerolineaceae bacterium 4572_5.1]|nr:MAG: hypothetical protein B5M51_08050 [Anaerolinea sp. 4484_236]OQY31123.1 MAG: hypothetical protein B6I38_06290 [Anaerolineaceae bacterium 4572_5.1]